MIGIQALRRVEFIHGRSIIHRDISPNNLLMGNGDEKNTLFVVGYGVAKRYRDPGTREHIPYRDDKNLVGHARCASVNSYRGLEQSRCDDLESLGYVLFYVRKGELPWQGLSGANTKEKYRKIRKRKRRTSFSELCKDMPSQFIDYFRYVKGLEFEERPDYSYLRELLRKALRRNALVDDGVFDWMHAPADTRT